MLLVNSAFKPTAGDGASARLGRTHETSFLPPRCIAFLTMIVRSDESLQDESHEILT